MRSDLNVGFRKVQLRSVAGPTGRGAVVRRLLPGYFLTAATTVAGSSCNSRSSPLDFLASS